MSSLLSSSDLTIRKLLPHLIFYLVVHWLYIEYICQSLHEAFSLNFELKNHPIITVVTRERISSFWGQFPTLLTEYQNLQPPCFIQLVELFHRFVHVTGKNSLVFKSLPWKIRQLHQIKKVVKLNYNTTQDQLQLLSLLIQFEDPWFGNLCICRL